MTEPTDGAKIGPIMAADCSTVITFLNVLPENVSFIIAVVTVSTIPFPRLDEASDHNQKVNAAGERTQKR